MAGLAERRLRYWGDIDTHGFAILNRLRQRFPSAGSLLMDRRTLFAHQEHWTVEKDPALETLPDLTEEEQQLYRGLLDDTYGRSVRLEQERVRFSLIRSAIQSLTG
ncbi:MAG TPA: Wadjet anti-phage system protein JetD domain-containing protein [Streptosporangiaceae bacterium]